MDSSNEPATPGEHSLSQKDEGTHTEDQKFPTTDRKHQSVYAGLGWIDRLLALWILLAIIVGMLIGNYADNAGEALQKGRFVGVSVPITVGLLVMMYPILCKVKFEVLHTTFRDRRIWTQLGFSVFMNWIIAPLFMVR